MSSSSSLMAARRDRPHRPVHARAAPAVRQAKLVDAVNIFELVNSASPATARSCAAATQRSARTSAILRGRV